MNAERVFSRNPGEREFLKSKHLLIVGAGSVGSALALMAARAGIGQLTIIDPEVLEPENIGRHVCDLRAAGRPKAVAVAEAIQAISPTASVRPRQADFRQAYDAGLNLDEHTLLVGATDSFECQSLVNLASRECNLPALYVGCWGEAAAGEILYVIPERTPCFECYAGFRRGSEPLSRDDPRKYTDLDFDTTRVPAQAGLWPNILVICGFAFQVLLALFGAGPEDVRSLLDSGRTLLLVNVSDFGSALPVWTVTPAVIEKGCGVCDPARLLAPEVRA